VVFAEIATALVLLGTNSRWWIVSPSHSVNSNGEKIEIIRRSSVCALMLPRIIIFAIRTVLVIMQEVVSLNLARIGCVIPKTLRYKM
jgi:hypothetical protein